MSKAYEGFTGEPADFDKLSKSGAFDAGHASAYTHKLGCNENHTHHSPECCADSCWCIAAHRAKVLPPISYSVDDARLALDIARKRNEELQAENDRLNQQLAALDPVLPFPQISSIRQSEVAPLLKRLTLYYPIDSDKEPVTRDLVQALDKLVKK